MLVGLEDESKEEFGKKTFIPLQTESVKSTMFSHTNTLKHLPHSVSPILVDLEAEIAEQSGSITSPVLVDHVIENAGNITSPTNNSRHEMQAVVDSVPEVKEYNEQKIVNQKAGTTKQAGNKTDSSMEKATNGTESVSADYIALTLPCITDPLEQESDTSDSWVCQENIMPDIFEDSEVKYNITENLNLINGSEPSNHSFTNVDEPSLPSFKSSTVSETKLLGIVDTIGSPANKRKKPSARTRKRNKRKRMNDNIPEPISEVKTEIPSCAPTTPRPLNLLITDKHYPDVMLTKQDMIFLQTDVNLEILKLPEDETLPLFKSVYMHKGGIHITCGDNYALDWITNKLPRVRHYKKRHLIIYEFIPVTTWIKFPTLKPKDLLTLIRRMNPCLHTSVWKYDYTKKESEGYELFLEVDAKSMEELIRLKGKVNIGLGALTFRFKQNESKEKI